MRLTTYQLCYGWWGDQILDLVENPGVTPEGEIQSLHFGTALPKRTPSCQIISVSLGFWTQVVLGPLLHEARYNRPVTETSQEQGHRTV